MKKSGFTEEQIVRILKEVEAGAEVGETCRKHGISEPTYYVWEDEVRAHGRITAAALEGLRSRIVATQAHVCRSGAGASCAEGCSLAKILSQTQRLELSLAMQTDYGSSARRADRAMALSRSARHCRPRPRDDALLIEAMQAHLKDNPSLSFGLICDQALRAHG